MYWTDGAWGWGAWLFMALSVAVFCGLIAWVVMMVLRSTSPLSSEWRSDPEAVLADRFASGEIDEAEYRQSIATLREHRSEANT